MTDDPILVRAIFLAAGADPTKLTRWIDDNMPNPAADETDPIEVTTPHAA